MRRLAFALLPILVVCACVGNRSTSRAPVTSHFKELTVPAAEFRIQVRGLLRPALGIVEERADTALSVATEPRLRRRLLIWKIETTTTLLSSLLRDDPLLALGDAWGYVFQQQAAIADPNGVNDFGEHTPAVERALTELDALFLEFAGSVQEDLSGTRLQSAVRHWAEKHPIQGALYRRPSMDSAVAKLLASEESGGALAALGGLEETTADVMMRLDLYTTYLPRLARWEAEVAAIDLAGGVDARSVMSELERATRSADRIAGTVEGLPPLVARERQNVLEAVTAERLALLRDVRDERLAVLDAIRQERVEALREIEAVAGRLLDRMGGPLQQSVREELDALVVSVEDMRKRLIVESGTTLDEVVDHAFYRALQLLLIAMLLAAAGVFVGVRWLRR